jgi:hypothetical protein
LQAAFGPETIKNHYFWVLRMAANKGMFIQRAGADISLVLSDPAAVNTRVSTGK